ncbi:efflux RND transporter periplasmic adaptor subunit [Paremcibacter congregatus]|uniref:Secretion protein HylD n=1 Tax=Paremcibacter congregatus TaxID=2043170 RepID=A0A2G4YNH9_9PROT|nr:HlyD family efflux transporter periplasmic adaptor subunit [Paremcibacter congregatus]PHZ83884.1 secretion protein HylD [Paremcibacter congregatus]QDE27588.1 HlyD family efflux transporter periplasmic adaptor subunit [Paremcibacter congregatus]
MDIAITKKKIPNIKRYILLFLLALSLFFTAKYLWFLGQADFSIDRDTVVLSEVKRGKFTVSVRGTGVLVPDNIEWLSANVDAKVVKLEVKAGNFVKKGDLILELSNPQLIQQFAEAQWELEAREAELKAAKTAQESALLEQKANVLNAKMDYESSLLTYNAQGELFNNQSAGAVSKITFEITRLETDQLKQRWLISQEQRVKMEENLFAQNNARAARLNQTKKILERFQQQVDNLHVKATMDSVVLEMPLEAGQSIKMGANIAKLAQEDSLIAELQVPEIQIRDVAVGQRVIIDTRNNKMEGRVARIDPSVINGNVQIDVIFSENLPDDARADLSVDGEIIITEITDALYVDRPLFAQSKSKSAFYKLIQDGQFAQRVEVTSGYGSVNQIQIIDGLQAGDKIITSDPTRMESYNKIRIN